MGCLYHYLAARVAGFDVFGSMGGRHLPRVVIAAGVDDSVPDKLRFVYVSLVIAGAVVVGFMRALGLHRRGTHEGEDKRR